MAQPDLWGSGKRIQELATIRMLMDQEDNFNERFRQLMEETLQRPCTEWTLINVTAQLTARYAVGAAKNTYKTCVLLEEDDPGTERLPHYRRSASFTRLLQNPAFRSAMLEALDFAMDRWQREYAKTYQDTNFVLYQKYSYDDVMRLLDWPKAMVSLNIGGYTREENTRTFPVFINYEKAEGISETTRYEDRFENPEILTAISKSKATLQNPDVQTALHAADYGYTATINIDINRRCYLYLEVSLC